MKNPNNFIGNQTCDLLACSTVPQPTDQGHFLSNLLSTNHPVTWHYNRSYRECH